MPRPGAHARPSPQDPESFDEVSPEVFERSLLGRPASMGRREVSRGAGVSVRSARKFWHALGFPVVGANHESGVGVTILDWVAAGRTSSSTSESAGAAVPA